MEDYTKVNSAADSKESEAMQRLQNYMEAGKLRLDTAQKITNNRDSIVQETLAQLKVNDTSINQKYDACVEHLNFLLNGITYAVMAGNESAIDRFLPSWREIYVPLDASIETTVRVIQVMKKVTANYVAAKAVKELEPYFEYIVQDVYSFQDEHSPSTFPASLSDGDSITEPLSQDKDKVERINNSATPAKKIRERGNRAIAIGAGYAFLGGLFAQLPGAIAGAVFGVLFGLFVNSKRAPN
jgi:Phycobilisome protein